METTKKAFNFDLKVKELNKYFGSNVSEAYTQIRDFLTKNGFEHRQGSEYHSNESIKLIDVVNLTEQMSKELPWLKHCVTKFDVTEIGELHDLTAFIKNDNNTKI